MDNVKKHELLESLEDLRESPNTSWTEQLLDIIEEVIKSS